MRLYNLDTYLLLGMWFANIFSQSISSFNTLSNVISHIQSCLLVLMGPTVPNFPSMPCIFGIKFKNSCLSPRCYRISSPSVPVFLGHTTSKTEEVDQMKMKFTE